MTATLHRLGAGRDAGLYYTNDAEREARPRNRDEYYSREGGGVWWSTGDSVVRNGAAVTMASFRDLCGGLDPGSGEALVRGAGEGHRAGIDLTLTPGKSVSVLWMAGTPEQRRAIEAAHHAAVDRAMQFVVDEGLVLVRHGPGGIYKDKPQDLIIARFDHFTTREGDPNIHTHSVLLNVAGGPVASGRYATRYLTIEPERLFQWQRTVGAAFRSSFSAELRSLGLSTRPAGQGQWEVEGIPQEVLEAFSKRSHQIEERVGRDASAAQKQVAALATRASKDTVPSGEELESRWREELTQTGIDPWWAALNVDHDRTIGPDQHHPRDHDLVLDPPEIDGTTPVALAVSALFRHETVLDRRRLLENAFIEAGLQGLGPDVVYEELSRLEEAGSLLRLDSEHWTTPGLAAIEAAMLRAAARPQERDWFNAEAVKAALAAAPHLSDEQRDAVLHAVRSDGVGVIEAGAGTGKTTLAKVLVDAARRSGLTVIGLAPSWVAADELSRSTGIEALAIARWRWATEQRNALNEKHLILVDEAGMTGTRDMEAVLSAAAAAGAKVVLMGDRRQLEAVPGASALRAIRDVVQRSAVLDQVRRQQVDWQRAASVLMARGDAEAGLRAYAGHDRLELVAGDEVALTRVVELWRDARRQHGEDVLMITRRNVDATALNLAARQVLKAEGMLGTEEIEVPTIGRDDKRGTLRLSPGDHVRFGETLPEIGLRNGTRATVQDVSHGANDEVRLRLRLEDGRHIETKWSDLTRTRPGLKKPLPRISHAYAGTAHAAQGRTADATIFYVARQTDARELYVGLTRHRHDARIVVESNRLEAACRQRQTDSRTNPTQTAMKERLFAEARQYREKANVIDFVADRGAFIASGKIALAQPERIWSIGRALNAARALRELLHWLEPAQIAVPIRRLLLLGRRLTPDLPQPLRALADSLRGRRTSQIRRRSQGPSLDQ